jgi:Tat protein translocase TatB subunit
MLLFILESIGTSELILIGIVALIFLGPRKLPQIARTIGKTMAEFRNTTNEFKSTWQREVDFEEEVSALRTGELPDTGPSPVPRTGPTLENPNSIAPPSIRPVQTDLFDDVPREAKPDAENDDTPADDDLSDKRNWL